MSAIAPAGSKTTASPGVITGTPMRPVSVEVPAGGAVASSASAKSDAEIVVASRGTMRAVVELAKPGITRLVTITAFVGFVLASVGRDWSFRSMLVPLIGCLVGTALSSGGANAINQWMERVRDARMHRTRKRPLVQERITPGKAIGAGLAMSVVGVAILALACGPAAAGVSLATILIYVLIYTPSKPLTVWNTIIGAVPGALPPMIGWCAALHPMLGWSRSMESLIGPAALGGWSLFALMFVWQIPHFLAIAWMYRADYAAGGYRMLPVVDASGKLTSAMMLSWACVLMLASVWPALVMSDRLGWGTIGVGVLTGAAFIAMIVRFVRSRADGDARRVFFASITHLPVLTLTMVIEAVLGAGWHA